ncbi:hypothetical protein JYT74_01680, partial [Crocinitomix catalasitica]|nr:hypothetical protein [Crocinitomix catalasitica]
MLRKLIGSTLIFLICTPVQGQDYVSFNEKRNNLSKSGMVTLGSWAVVNLIGSTTGLLLSKGEYYKGFHQMNILFNVVNLGLAIPSYFGAKNDDPKSHTLGESYQLQLKKEKLFVINTAFDFVYITGGVRMIQRAKWDTANSDKLRGFGTSLIIQGAFLFSFDFAMTLLHSRNRKKNF